MIKDLDQLRIMYREFYTDLKKRENKPISHIDDFSTYFVEMDRETWDVFDELSEGKTSEELDHIMKYISDNMPTFNINILLKKDNETYPLYSSILENKKIGINGLSELIDPILKVYDYRDSSRTSPEIKKAVQFALSLSVLTVLCKRLSSENCYVGSEVAECRNKRTGRIYPLEIIHVSIDKKIQKIGHVTGEKIEWKHSWLVVGHWRKIKGIGKDRYGNRVIVGKTWVIPTVKGVGVFIEKLRMVN